MNLNIIPNGAIKRVHVSQNDVGRTLTFELFNNSTSYTIPNGATVKIQGTKPSGLGFSETCTVNGNVVTVDTTETMTDEFGYIDAELQIKYNGNTIGTSNFVLAVEKNPHPDTTTDGSMETIIPELTLLVNEVKGYAEEIEGTYHAYGSPWVASTVAEMTDTDKIYVYTGSETGYTNGNWYYYNGSSWVSGGVYNAVAVNTDTTLTQSGVSADAKAVGDEISDLKDDLSDFENACFDVETITSKNLLDLSEITESSNLDGSGNVVSHTSRCVTGYMNAVPGKYVVYSYYYNGTQRAGTIQRICYYDENHTFLSYVNDNTSVIPENSVYFRCALQNASLESSTTDSNYMIELSDDGSFTSYEAYTPASVTYTLKDDVLSESVKESLDNVDTIGESVTSLYDLVTEENAYTERTDLGHDMTWTSGYVDTNGGVNSSDSYYYSTKISVKKGDVLTSSYSFRFCCAYNGETAVSASGATSVSSYTVPSGVDGVVVSIASSHYQDKGIIVLTEGETETRALTRGKLYIHTTDTQGEILDKLIYAYEHGDYDVYWETGTYTFNSIFETMYTDYGYTIAIEIPIGGNCRYFFNGSTITGTQTSSNATVFDNSSLFGSRRASGSYEMYDGNLVGNDLIYIVHDESAGAEEPYKRVYKNMRMTYNTASQTSSLRKCIGGGAGQHGIIDIDGCVFVSDNVQEVSYHGNSTSGITCHLDLTCKNSYFNNRLQLNSMYTNGDGIAVVTNNSFGSSLNAESQWTVYAWNNEVRS